MEKGQDDFLFYFGPYLLSLTFIRIHDSEAADILKKNDKERKKKASEKKQKKFAFKNNK